VVHHRLLAFAACFALAVLAACGSAAKSTSCQDASQCPAQARCIQSTCVGNTPPSAAIAPITEGVAAFAVAQLNGAGSSDPDEGDELTSFAWTVTAADAPCPPPVVASTSSVVNVRFACPGRYVASLVVTDALGATSPPATRDLTVGPGTSAIVAGLDVQVQHACAGDPLLCSTSPVLLTASEVGAPIPDLGWTWRALAPPDRPLEAGRRVTIAATGPSAVVAIETDGLAISGDWLFEVTASDAAGAVGVATQRLSVLNRPPEIVGAPAATYPHAFDRLASVFTSGGSFALTFSDPDGDPLTREFTANHAGDGPSSTFNAAYDDAGVSFSIVVPYGAPADAAFLIGDDVSRSVTLAVSDVNGGAVSRTFDLVVGNRPPRATTVPAEVSVPHSFDAASSRYLASATVGTWVDDDGDPLLGAPTNSPVCDTFTAGVDFRVSCSLPFLGAPNVAVFATRHGVSLRVRDPWAMSAERLIDVVIQNRSPVLAVSSLASTMTCSTGSGCCIFIDRVCEQAKIDYSSGDVFLVRPFVDPDGDPLELGVAGVPRFVCTADQCSFSTPVGGRNDTCSGYSISISGNDGLALTSGLVDLGCSGGGIF
jgi:hypothetical protein